MPKRCIAVDVGGTSTKFGRVNSEGGLEARWEIPTRTQEGGSRILPEIAASIQAHLRDHGIAMDSLAGVGLGVPGPVDARGVVRGCVNLGWGCLDPARELGGLLGLDPARIRAANDANAAALGEQWMGSGKGCRDLVMFTLGTGVGGGVILDGRIVAGSRGLGGELGHLTVNPLETAACSCGNCGCLEQYASATGIVRQMRSVLEAGEVSSTLRGLEELTCKAVLDAARAGDEAARQTVDLCMGYLAIGMAAAVYAVDPQMIVIGGGVAQAGPYLLECVMRHFRARHALTGEEIPVVLAGLGSDAGIYGAARLVLQGQEETI